MPLTEVYGYLELLTAYQGHLNSETQAQFLVRAKEGCQELIRLINQVLDALAVTEEVQPPPCEWIALAPLVRDVLEHLDPHKGEADRVSLALARAHDGLGQRTTPAPGAPQSALECLQVLSQTDQGDHPRQADR